MDKGEIRQRLRDVEKHLADDIMAEFGTFERDGRQLRLYLTSRFRRKAKRARCWATPHMCSAVSNAAYGFDPEHPRSRGGSDGVFLVDRTHRPSNQMMRKLFDGFLDVSGGEAEAVAKRFGVEAESLLAVRLVCHSVRLLGVLHRAAESDHLVLVDVDASA